MKNLAATIVLALILSPALLAIAAPVDAAGTKAFDLKYRCYGRGLKKYVKGDSGLVHYRLWKADRAGLDAFVATVAGLDRAQYEKFDEKAKLAFWLNVYNALAIQSVLDHYPVKAAVDYFPPDSIRQFNDGWEVLKFDVMGQPITLYDVEHDRLRRLFRDPRVHFAVASASKDSARLSPEPYVGANLDGRLDALTRHFLEQPYGYVLDPARHTVRVSKIFSWFTLDFAARAGYGKALFPPPKDEDIVLDYIALYLSDEKREQLKACRADKAQPLNFDYLPYDWGLNDADK